MPAPPMTPAIAVVLEGVTYPARTWQLLAQADYYGVDTHTREQLHRLPIDTYTGPDAVLAVLAGAAAPDPPATSP